MTQPQLYRELADLTEENETLKAEVEALRSELEATKKQVPAEVQVWFTPAEAAKFIGKPVSFFRNHRDRIPYRRDSYKVIRYHRDDLQAFIDAHRRDKKGAKK